MSNLFPLLCFPSVGLTQQWMHAENPVFEVQDHYQKQTFRNRFIILQSTGVQALSIPIHFHKHGEPGYASIQIDNRTPWFRTHWRSLCTAYNKAPFFEHYSPFLENLLYGAPSGLMDFNLKVHHWLQKVINLPDFSLSTTWKPLESPEQRDYRSLDQVRHELHLQHASYTQVFSDRLAFTPGCSVLDLLFNAGPESYWILKGNGLK